jgi:hypothetical protein
MNVVFWKEAKIIKNHDKTLIQRMSLNQHAN